MACNDYRIYNYESYSQNFVYDDCDGLRYNVTIPAAGTGGLNPYRTSRTYVGTIISYGTLIFEIHDGGEIPSEPTGSCEFPAAIHPLTWWGIDVPTASGWGSIYECEEGQS